MRYMMIVRFTDLADDRLRVATKFIEAATDAAAAAFADEVAGHAALLSPLLPAVQRLPGLERTALLPQASDVEGMGEEEEDALAAADLAVPRWTRRLA